MRCFLIVNATISLTGLIVLGIGLQNLPNSVPGVSDTDSKFMEHLQAYRLRSAAFIECIVGLCGLFLPLGVVWFRFFVERRREPVLPLDVAAAPLAPVAAATAPMVPVVQRPLLRQITDQIEII
jgi:hypothetical protein